MKFNFNLEILGALVLGALFMSACSDSDSQSNSGDDLFASEYDSLFDSDAARQRYTLDPNGSGLGLEGFWVSNPASESSENGGSLYIRLKIEKDSLTFGLKCTKGSEKEVGSSKVGIEIDAPTKGKVNFLSETKRRLNLCQAEFKVEKGAMAYSISGLDLNFDGQRFIKVGELSDDPKKRTNPSPSPSPSPDPSKVTSFIENWGLVGEYMRSSETCDKSDAQILESVSSDVDTLVDLVIKSDSMKTSSSETWAPIMVAMPGTLAVLINGARVDITYTFYNHILRLTPANEPCIVFVKKV